MTKNPQPTRPQWQLHLGEEAHISPWRQAIELAESLPSGSWTLIGGLMVHVHARHANLPPVRATVDVDLILHLETDKISWAMASHQLRQLGYQVHRSEQPYTPVHRFIRATDIVDVLVADHLAPRALRERGATHAVVAAPGGTSALRKTLDCHLIVTDQVAGSQRDVLLSVPDVLGALSLKGGAYVADSRGVNRHLEDAVVLAATIEDADAITSQPHRWTRGDQRRLQALAQALSCDHPAWGLLPANRRARAQKSLELLAKGPS